MAPTYSRFNSGNFIGLDAISTCNVSHSLAALNGSAYVNHVFLSELSGAHLAAVPRFFRVVPMKTAQAFANSRLSMMLVFSMSYPFQIFTAIIFSVVILVVDFIAFWRESMESFANKSMKPVVLSLSLPQPCLYAGISVRIDPRLKDFADSRAICLLASPHSPQIRHFIKTLKPFRGLPELVWHGKIVSQGIP